MTTAPPVDRRTFVPKDIDLADVARLEPLYQALLDRGLTTTADVESWLADYSELSAAVGEYGSRTSIDAACHTDDQAIEKRYLHFIENVLPKLAPYGFKLKQKLLAAPCLDQLTDERYRMLIREWRSDVEIYRDQNIPLSTELAKLNQEYDKLIGAMTVEFRGEQRTLQQMALFLDDTDRDTRETAWRLTTERRLQDAEAIHDIFAKMIGLRRQMADNADKPDFRAYTWTHYNRFDYTPDDCLAFADAIEQAVVPRVRELDKQRQAALGVETLRPWDMSVDVKGRPRLEPFPGSDVQVLVDKTRAIFERIDPSLAADFGRLTFGRNLDLESRKGKRAGGFQSSLLESGEPFIFMNAAGQHRDVETMLHEGGHAFHFMWAQAVEPLVFLQHAPIEFCEVASMSMELLADPFLDVFYADPADADRARRKHLEGILRFFPWMAVIDTFQHWLYTHPGHDLDQRTAAWLDTLDRFSSGVVDESGLEDARAAQWQRQLHLFHCPFYYVEYGIAQLGALQLWLYYQEDPDAAIADYRKALTLGGGRPLPALFEAAGIRFDFSRDTLEPLIETVAQELASLPE